MRLKSTPDPIHLVHKWGRQETGHHERGHMAELVRVPTGTNLSGWS